MRVLPHNCASRCRGGQAESVDNLMFTD